MICVARCLLALTAIGLSLGCAKSDCEKACEATKDCPQVSPAFGGLDCGDACDFQEDQSNAAGCGAQFDAFNACGAANVDLACESGTCGAEAQTWSNCLGN